MRFLYVSVAAGLMLVMITAVGARASKGGRPFMGEAEIKGQLLQEAKISGVMVFADELVSAINATRNSGMRRRQNLVGIHNCRIIGTLHLEDLARKSRPPSKCSEACGLSSSAMVFLVSDEIWIENCELDSVTALHEEGRVVFTSDIFVLRDSVIHGSVDFTLACFAGLADLKDNLYQGDTNFRKCIFGGQAYFSRCSFKGKAVFDAALFNLEAYFNAVRFAEEASYRNTAFRSEAIFGNPNYWRFGIDTSELLYSYPPRKDYGGSKIVKNDEGKLISVWGRAVFNSTCFFIGANFYGKATFRKGMFSGFTSFSNAVFYGPVDLHEAEFQHAAVFRSAKFENWADLGAVNFGRKVTFQKASFLDMVSFDTSILESPWLFASAQFSGITSFRLSEIKGAEPFVGAQAQNGLVFEDTRFSSEKDASQAYRLASKGWAAVADKREELLYFYKYMVARRKALKNGFERGIEWLFIDLTCAYGTSWQRTIITWGVVIFLSTLIFWQGKGIIRCADGEATKSFWQSLYFSIMTFVTLGTSEYRPRLIHRRKIPPRFRSNRKLYDPRRCFDFIDYIVRLVWEYIGRAEWFRVIVSAEALIGAFMIALLVLVFARHFLW